jgi:hypothetical protein
MNGRKECADPQDCWEEYKLHDILDIKHKIDQCYLSGVQFAISDLAAGDKAETVLTEANAHAKGFKIVHGEWVQLFSSGYGTEQVDPIDFNREFLRVVFGPGSPVPIVKRECEGCVESHQEIYFKRKTNLATFDAHGFLIEAFGTKPDAIGTDFAMYSRLADAIADSDPWKADYCSFASDAKFPFGCGPTKAANEQHYPAQTKVKYSVLSQQKVPSIFVNRAVPMHIQLRIGVLNRN